MGAVEEFLGLTEQVIYMGAYPMNVIEAAQKVVEEIDQRLKVLEGKPKFGPAPTNILGPLPQPAPTDEALVEKIADILLKTPISPIGIYDIARRIIAEVRRG